MAKDLFLDVQELERRKLEFDTTYAPGSLSLPDNWKAVEDLEVEGAAELLDRRGSRTIRIKGRLAGRVENECARCLSSLQERLEGDFELYFYPMEMIAKSEEVAINHDDADIGFYEGTGIALGEAVREQVVLWLPMRGLCREDCRGLCPRCGVNRNERSCSCKESLSDPRWDALKNLRLDG